MYTKGDWQARKLLPDRHGIITKEAWEITTPEYDVVARIIGSAPIRNEADAHLIVAAVNACIKINPDNPQAVAEALPDMYEALQAFDHYLCASPPHNLKLKKYAVELLEKALAGIK